MSAYDITEFLRTAYRPFAYCVPSKSPLNTAYQKGGGVTLSYLTLSRLSFLLLLKFATFLYTMYMLWSEYELQFCVLSTDPLRNAFFLKKTQLNTAYQKWGNPPKCVDFTLMNARR